MIGGLSEVQGIENVKLGMMIRDCTLTLGFIPTIAGRDIVLAAAGLLLLDVIGKFAKSLLWQASMLLFLMMERYVFYRFAFPSLLGRLFLNPQGHCAIILENLGKDDAVKASADLYSYYHRGMCSTVNRYGSILRNADYNLR